jgi:hypothetical protein
MSDVPKDIQSLSHAIFRQVQDLVYDEYDGWEDKSRAAIAKAILAERERCAQIADDISSVQARGWEKNPKKDGCGGAIAAANTGSFIATAIRLTTLPHQEGA